MGVVRLNLSWVLPRYGLLRELLLLAWIGLSFLPDLAHSEELRQSVITEASDIQKVKVIFVTRRLTASKEHFYIDVKFAIQERLFGTSHLLQAQAKTSYYGGVASEIQQPLRGPYSIDLKVGDELILFLREGWNERASHLLFPSVGLDRGILRVEGNSRKIKTFDSKPITSSKKPVQSIDDLNLLVRKVKNRRRATAFPETRDR